MTTLAVTTVNSLPLPRSHQFSQWLKVSAAFGHRQGIDERERLLVFSEHGREQSFSAQSKTAFLASTYTLNEVPLDRQIHYLFEEVFVEGRQYCDVTSCGPVLRRNCCSHQSDPWQPESAAVSLVVVQQTAPSVTIERTNAKAHEDRSIPRRSLDATRGAQLVWTTVGRSNRLLTFAAAFREYFFL